MAFYKGWTDDYTPVQPHTGPREAIKTSPLSQIPGIGDYGSPAVKDQPIRQWIKDSDTEYVRLAKQGGHADLLSGKAFLDLDSISKEVKRSLPNTVTAPYATTGAAAAPHVKFAAGDASHNVQTRDLEGFRPQSSASTTSMGQYEYDIRDGAPLPEEYYRQSYPDHVDLDQQAASYGSGSGHNGLGDGIRTILTTEDYNRMRAKYPDSNRSIGLNHSDATLIRGLTLEDSRNNSSERQEQHQMNWQQTAGRQADSFVQSNQKQDLHEPSWHQPQSATANGKVEPADSLRQIEPLDFNECQQNKRKQTDGSEISRLLSFDYVKSRTTPRSRASKPPIQPNRAAGTRQTNPSPAGVTSNPMTGGLRGQSNPITGGLREQSNPITGGLREPSNPITGGTREQGRRQINTNSAGESSNPVTGGFNGQSNQINEGVKGQSIIGRVNGSSNSNSGIVNVQSTNGGINGPANRERESDPTAKHGGGTSRRTPRGTKNINKNKTVDQDRFDGRNNVEQTARSSSATRKGSAASSSSYVTEYQEKMSADGANNKWPGNSLAKARSLQNIVEMSHGNRKLADNRPDFLRITSPVEPPMEKAQQFGRRKPSVELRPDFLLSSPYTSDTTTRDIDRFRDAHLQQEIKRQEFGNFQNSPLMEAASILHQKPLEDQSYEETNQRYDMTADDTYQLPQQQKSFRRQKADVNFCSPVGSAVVRRK